MDINTARLILFVRTKATLRRVAEIYYPKNHEFYGNQLAGEYLVKEATKILGNMDENGHCVEHYDDFLEKFNF